LDYRTHDLSLFLTKQIPAGTHDKVAFANVRGLLCKWNFAIVTTPACNNGPVA